MTVSKWAGVAAIVFAVLFVAGVVVGNNSPDGNDPDAKWVDFYSDSSQQTQDIVAAYLETAAALALVGFAAVAFGSVGGLAAAARAFAYTAAAAFALGRVALATVSAEVKFSSAPINADVARAMSSLGFGIMLVAGGVAAAAMIAAISGHWMRTRRMPRWLVWFGFVCAFIALFSVVFLPLAALPIWALVVGIVLLTGKGAVATEPATMGRTEPRGARLASGDA